MKKFVLSTIALSVASVASTAGAQHVDVLLAERDGQVVSGGYDFSTTSFVGLGRVFEGELEAPGYGGDEPGFNAVSDGSVLPSGVNTLPGSVSVGFNIVTTTIGSETRNLFFWDGTGGVDFQPVPDLEQFIISKQVSPFSFLTAVADGSSSAVAGFEIDDTASDGFLHKHIDFFAVGDSGGTDDPTHGFYLLSLSATADGLDASLPFWIVYHVGAPADPFGEEEHEAAVDWVQGNLVPEPASLTMLGLAGLSMLRRRRA